MRPRPLIDFTWSPTAGPVAFTLGGEFFPPAGSRYAASKTPVATAVRFTARVDLLGGAPILRYDWDFGDGHRGSGLSVSHVYPFKVVEAQVTLTVTDTKRQQFRVSKMVNLVIPPDYLNSGLYVNADTVDNSPVSALNIDMGTGRFTLVPQVDGFGRHTEYTYGFMFTPTNASTSDVEITQKVFTGHNSMGTLQGASGDQRWNPQFGIGAKITPGNELTGRGLFGSWDPYSSSFEIDFYDYTGPGGWFVFGSGAPLGGVANTSTIEAGNSLLPGTHYYGTPVVAHTPMPTHSAKSEFFGWDEYGIAGTIDTFYWIVLRLVSNTIEFELWNQNPTTPGSDFVVKLRTALTDPGALALFGSGAPGGWGPMGWTSPPPHSYIAEWSYIEL